MHSSCARSSPQFRKFSRVDLVALCIFPKLGMLRGHVGPPSIEIDATSPEFTLQLYAVQRCRRRPNREGLHKPTYRRDEHAKESTATLEREARRAPVQRFFTFNGYHRRNEARMTEHGALNGCSADAFQRGRFRARLSQCIFQDQRYRSSIAESCI